MVFVQELRVPRLPTPQVGFQGTPCPFRTENTAVLLRYLPVRETTAAAVEIRSFLPG